MNKDQSVMFYRLLTFLDFVFVSVLVYLNEKNILVVSKPILITMFVLALICIIFVFKKSFLSNLFNKIIYSVLAIFYVILALDFLVFTWTSANELFIRLNQILFVLLLSSVINVKKE